MTGSVAVDIDVEGLTAVRRALSGLDREALRRLDGELRRAARLVASEAGRTVATRATTHSGEVPPAARSYRVEYRSRRGVRHLRIVSTARGASIIEWACRAGARTPRGRTLGRTLDERYGRPGRVLWATWERREREVMGRVEAAVREAERHVEDLVRTGMGGV